MKNSALAFAAALLAATVCGSAAASNRAERSHSRRLVAHVARRRVRAAAGSPFRHVRLHRRAFRDPELGKRDGFNHKYPDFDFKSESDRYRMPPADTYTLPRGDKKK